MERTYHICGSANGGFGGGYGGVYAVELTYTSRHRARSADNLLDARAAYRRRYGCNGTIVFAADTCRLVRE